MHARSPPCVLHDCVATAHGNTPAEEGVTAIFTGPARVTSSLRPPIRLSVSGKLKRSERSGPRSTTSMPEAGALTQLVLPPAPSSMLQALIIEGVMPEQSAALVSTTACRAAPLVGVKSTVTMLP